MEYNEYQAAVHRTWASCISVIIMCVTLLLVVINYRWTLETKARCQAGYIEKLVTAPQTSMPQKIWVKDSLP
jgi:hypothetical protein